MLFRSTSFLTFVSFDLEFLFEEPFQSCVCSESRINCVCGRVGPSPQPPAPAGACHQPAGTPYAPRVPARGVAVAAQAVTPVNCWRQRGEHSLQGVEEILQLVSIKQVPMVGYLPGPRSCRSPHQCPPPHIILLSPSISRILLPRREIGRAHV